MISRENELDTWNLIEEVCDEALSKFRWNIKEDQNMLNKDKLNGLLTFNERNCIKYIMGEKSVLLFFKDCSRKVK